MSAHAARSSTSEDHSASNTAAAIAVRRAERGDLQAIAAIHVDAFPDGALTMLGVGAVRRYYAWQLEPVHDAAALVAVQHGGVVGFCFGGVFRGAMEGFLRKNTLFLIGATMLRPAVFLQPRVRRGMISGVRTVARAAYRRLLGRREAGNALEVPTEIRSFGILAIATERGRQGSGVGRTLMASAADEARRRGFTRMRLSVHSANKPAVRFYEAQGWRRVLHGEVWHGEMERLIDDGHPSGS